MDKEQARQLFMPVAVVEHHQMTAPQLATFDVCDRLGEIWVEIREEAQQNALSLDADSILSVHARIAKALGEEPGSFRAKDGWPGFVEACGNIEEDPAHTFSWILCALYWNHLTQFKLATAWLFVNGLRLQYGFPEYRLKLERLGEFLESLSGAGPPIYDGQTFYPEDYS